LNLKLKLLGDLVNIMNDHQTIKFKGI